jgi:hypothetical protein
MHKTPSKATSIESRSSSFAASKRVPRSVRFHPRSRDVKKEAKHFLIRRHQHPLSRSLTTLRHPRSQALVVLNHRISVIMVIVIIFFLCVCRTFFTLHQTHERAPAEKIYLHKFQAKFFSFFSVRGVRGARGCEALPASRVFCAARRSGVAMGLVFCRLLLSIHFPAIMMLLKRGGCKFYGNRRARVEEKQQKMGK